MSTPRILVYGPDAQQLDTVLAELHTHGFIAVGVKDGIDVLDQLNRTSWDMLLIEGEVDEMPRTILKHHLERSRVKVVEHQGSSLDLMARIGQAIGN
ncbi:MAG: hypothetical protein ABI599_13295 [Flavobacteriales bacterium]